MTNANSTVKTLRNEFEELCVSEPRCADWAARVQHVCIQLYPQFRQPAEDVDQTILNGLISLLKQDDAFQLAQTTIPELRWKEDDNCQPPSPRSALEMIISGTADLRNRSGGVRAPDPETVDPLFDAEQETVIQAAASRAMVHRVVQVEQQDGNGGGAAEQAGEPTSGL